MATSSCSPRQRMSNFLKNRWPCKMPWVSIHGYLLLNKRKRFHRSCPSKASPRARLGQTSTPKSRHEEQCGSAHERHKVGQVPESRWGAQADEHHSDSREYVGSPRKPCSHQNQTSTCQRGGPDNDGRTVSAPHSAPPAPGWPCDQSAPKISGTTRFGCAASVTKPSTIYHCFPQFPPDSPTFVALSPPEHRT